MKATREARFWVWHGESQVRIKMQPGQTIEHYQWEETDEGWSSEHVVYDYDEETHTVTCGWYDRSRDCDGVHGSGGEHSCKVYRLNGEYNDGDEDNISYPEWGETKRTPVYDQFAQAAGY